MNNHIFRVNRVIGVTLNQSPNVMYLMSTQPLLTSLQKMRKKRRACPITLACFSRCECCKKAKEMTITVHLLDVIIYLLFLLSFCILLRGNNSILMECYKLIFSFKRAQWNLHENNCTVVACTGHFSIASHFDWIAVDDLHKITISQQRCKSLQCLHKS